MISIYVQKGCNHSIKLLENIQTIEEYMKLNIFVKGNNDFPSFIKKTPTVIYNNIPYEGKNAFKLVKLLLLKINEKINSKKPNTNKSEPTEIKSKNDNFEDNMMLSFNDDSISAQALLTENGFEDNFIDYNTNTENTKVLNIEEYIQQRNKMMDEIIPPTNNDNSN